MYRLLQLSFVLILLLFSGPPIGIQEVSAGAISMHITVSTGEQNFHQNNSLQNRHRLKRQLKKESPEALAEQARIFGKYSIPGLIFLFPMGIVLAILALSYAQKAMKLIKADPDGHYSSAREDVRMARKYVKITVGLLILIGAIVTAGLILFPIY